MCVREGGLKNVLINYPINFLEELIMLHFGFLDFAQISQISLRSVGLG
jgi:hypothetical protein